MLLILVEIPARRSGRSLERLTRGLLVELGQAQTTSETLVATTRGRGNRIEAFNLFFHRPKPLIPRELTYELTERVNAAGAVIVPLAETEVASLGAVLAAQKIEVKIDNFSFSPSTLKVKVGTQITWTNSDDIPHTVVSNSPTFKSKVLGTGEKFTFTASKPGTYPYSCSIHPNMTGKVVVE